MKIFEKRLGNRKLSMYTKVMFSITFSLLAVILIIQVSNIHVINRTRQRAEELYQGSLDYYGGFWEEKLRTINTSLLTIIGYETGAAYGNICNSTDTLTVEVSKLQVLKELNVVSDRHENEVSLFVYIPEKHIYINSAKSQWDYPMQERINLTVREYADSGKTSNNDGWMILSVDNKPYLFKLFKMGNGYAGAFLEAELILEGFWGEQSQTGVAAIENEEGRIIAELGLESGQKSVRRFETQLGFTEIKLIVIMPYSILYNNKSYVSILTVATIAFAFGIVMLNMQFQKKVFFSPLEWLKVAMEKFSSGNTEIRLPDFKGNQEIVILYHTFNNMAEQITILKIEVYESEIENQKILSNYLKVQIQPHFYTNTLNLIHGLAQIKDYQAIQKLSSVMARYFRYLLGEKGTFVRMEEEIACVKDYVDIQKFRYGERFDFKMNVEENVCKQLVLPLIIQTFVENSIKHNVTLVPCLNVKVSVLHKNNNLWIVVEDNGIGFDAEVLKKINTGQNMNHGGEHIGIMNIKGRIRMFYQKEAHLTIDSEAGHTVLTLILPEVLPMGGEVE